MWRNEDKENIEEIGGYCMLENVGIVVGDEC